MMCNYVQRKRIHVGEKKLKGVTELRALRESITTFFPSFFHFYKLVSNETITLIFGNIRFEEMNAKQEKEEDDDDEKEDEKEECLNVKVLSGRNQMKRC